MTANVSYGIDIASYQAGVDLAEVKGEGFSFAYVKATQGTNYIDPQYSGWAGNPGGLHEIPYHYVTTESPNAQMAYFRKVVGEGPTECMLDEEVGGSSTGAQVTLMVEAAKLQGFSSVDLYLPHWRWLEIGSPDISKMGVRYLIASDYPNNSPGYASELYPGDGFVGWNEYGNKRPDILQFTDTADVDHQHVDADAADSSVTWATSAPVQTKPPVGGPPAGWSATVRQVQAALNRWPFYKPLAVDGGDGPFTKDAILIFQHAAEIVSDGVPGPHTWSKLNTIYDATRPELSVGDKSAAVRWLQEKLNSAHDYGLATDGDFGSKTLASVKDFQDKCELAVDGVVGKETNAALQL